MFTNNFIYIYNVENQSRKYRGREKRYLKELYT